MSTPSDPKNPVQAFFRDRAANAQRAKRAPAPVGLPDSAIEAVGFPGVRLSIDEADETLRGVADRLAPMRPLLGREDFNILALSGGAAGGAFGAGALVGLTKAGTRPRFAIVTGVSTGALIAPFAFLGPDWDDRLADAYIGGHASELLSLKRLGPTLGLSLFRGDSLDGLVAPFVDLDMIQAVAREHARGRRLLIATTNLDSQKATIWDMGEIATRGGEDAVRLFRDVLVASATLPGLFPPKLIDVEAADGDGGMARYQEMHADGGIAAPLFLMPDALLRWRDLGQRLRRGRVYVIFNTVLDPAPRTTQPGVASIMGRSFETMLRFSYRQALSVAAGFCARHNLPLWSASIPASFENFNMMKFETAVMRQTFDDAEALAINGRLWSSAIPTPEPLWRGLFKRLPPTPRQVVKDPILAPDTTLAPPDETFAEQEAPRPPERDEPIS
ncbi:patatin-like phospholipase family protein [Caulobacter sp. UNC279MFTsu5.1]|uniref:patatin-like phospholipase family protein n=1 Tax=Caulobacter sp. UNC279MFTsu5.1 TaxID=1502775 RepID=UPI00038140A2|nr:patatin-like phospholipase family protein [Caulobacter sp. UNC279MFTsu5.1]SFJ72219.1 Predicted acylesterase/phospholipase RssA, contains patatin domain [Caulobacter sp. UNC279MFTsu5.1]